MTPQETQAHLAHLETLCALLMIIFCAIGWVVVL